MTRTSGSWIPGNGPDFSAGRKLAVAVLTILLGTAGGGAAAMAAGLSVQKPWMRFIIKSRPAAGYFTLNNDTDSPVELTGASSNACDRLMLHQSKNVNGVEKMLPVKSLSVPAHGTLRFAPGSYHLMCMSPKSAMTVGATVPVTLKFADGKTITAQFPVKGASAR